MTMLVTTFLIIISTLLFYSFYRMRRQAMTIFKKMGIPGPEPNFLFGNLLEFRRTPLFRKHQEWRHVYGETFGYYEGPTPVLVTSDVTLLQEVFIKQFNKFHARKLWPVQVDPDKDEDVHMFFARGRRWKRLRLVVNPAFSASKIRQMAPTVNECINHLLDVIRDSASQAKDRTIELMELFRRLTLDTILRCEVGLDQNSVKNPDDPFLAHCKAVIDDTSKMPWLYLLGFLFPDLHCIWIAIYKSLHNIKFNPVFWLEDRMRRVVVTRRQIKENRRTDLMQQMLDAQFSSERVHDLESQELKLDSTYTRTLRSMTNQEIVSHALLFLLAGYETTSTTLSYIFFELSHNPHVQQRLRHEVTTVLSRGYNSIGYDDLKELTYLDYVIWETLRKYPLASTVTARRCMQDCTIGGLTLPAGMLVHANTWDVHYDPRHWGDDVHKFDPLRFTLERRRKRHPSAWMPFGSGPRSCAGLRFALLQLKMVVAKVLRDFDFHPCGSEALQLKEGATILPTDGVRLATMRRGSAMTETGLRRGSAMAGIPLQEWVNIRRASMRSRDYVSLKGEAVDGTPLATVRRESLSDRSNLWETERRNSQTDHCSHRNDSILENELMGENIQLMQEASISKGRELTIEESVNKGINLLRIASVCERRDSRDCQCDVSIGQNNTFLDNIVMARELDVTMGVSNMPEDILGDMPRLRSRKTLRRGSAVPELQSVGEMVAIETFKCRRHTHILTPDKLDDSWFKDGLWSQGARLYQRRGSG